MARDRVDAREVAADWTPRLAKVLQRAIEVRDSGAFDPERFFDLYFPELLADPMNVVECIFDHFALELTGEAADSMRAFIADNPQGRHGHHRYAPEEYGLGVSAERERFRRYTERFDVEPETRGGQGGAVRDM
jgi:hypothetical protein